MIIQFDTAAVSRSLLLTLLWLSLASGCGSDESKIHIHGTVTHDGQPVPTGSITFSPDTSKGNEGPGSMANIRDGRYSTQEGLGIVGGPHIVRIEGYDGVAAGDNSDGSPLFPAYETSVNLPTASGKFDFTVPGQ